MDKNTHLYEQLYTIRQFEITVIEQFPTGIFPGTTHTCLGQEANAVGVLSHLAENDVVVSNHRGHGHFLAYGGDPRALFAELMGRPTGICGGVGGSQHLHWRNFYSSGIQGGTVAMATGMALAEKQARRDAIVIDFLGDGTLGEGIVYECFNMASLWQVPILYVLEHNHIAQTTPTNLVLAGRMEQRFEAFDIPVTRLDSSDVLAVEALASDLIPVVRDSQSPQAVIIETARLGSHSKGDDTRTAEVLEHLWETRDPIKIHGARLKDDVRQEVEERVESRILSAYIAALETELEGEPG